MNILITVHTYYPNRDGVQFVTQYLAEGLLNKGYSVSILTYKYPGRCDIDEQVINGVSIKRWNVRTVHTMHIGEKKEYQTYILENQTEYDVMINVGTQTALTDWLFPIFDKIVIPKLLYIHSIWDFHIYDYERKDVKMFVSKLWADFRWSIYYKRNSSIFKKYQIITQLHPMDYSCAFFEEKYGVKCRIIENAAEEQFFESVPDNEMDLPEKFIINVANYNPRKNQRKCIDIFYTANIPDEWAMVLIGSQKNAYYEELVNYNNKRRNELGLIDEKKIYLLAEVPREMIYTYVKRSSMYFIGSTWEAFPVSIVEGMAAGVPFLSSDVGIIRYLPGGRVAHTDKEFIYWLEMFANNDELRKSYGNIARAEAVSKYKISDKVDQLEKYLLELTGEN